MLILLKSDSGPGSGQIWKIVIQYIQYNIIVFRAPNSLMQQRDGDADYYSVAR